MKFSPNLDNFAQIAHYLSIKLICIIVITMFCGVSQASAKKSILNSEKIILSTEYIITLTNGDIISGEVIEFVNSPEYGEGIKVDTELGKATIYEDQIKNISQAGNYYRHASRSLFLPTAYPIEDNHYIAASELLLASCGFGLFDFISVNAAHSFIPTDKLNGQIAYINTKFTVFNDLIDEDFGKLAIAPGVNYASLGSGNEMWHLFTAISLDFGTTKISSNVFYKLKGGDLYSYRLDNNLWNFGYPDGAFGISFSIDKELSAKGTHLFVELINGDLNNYKQTAIASGIRFSNRSFAADFGLIVAGGYPLPIMQFFWTPF